MSFWPCLAESTPVSALLLAFPQILEFFLHSRAFWNQWKALVSARGFWGKSKWLIFSWNWETKKTKLTLTVGVKYWRNKNYQKHVATLYLTKFVLSRLISSWNWLNRSCKYLKECFDQKPRYRHHSSSSVLGNHLFTWEISHHSNDLVKSKYHYVVSPFILQINMHKYIISCKYTLYTQRFNSMLDSCCWNSRDCSFNCGHCCRYSNISKNEAPIK